MSKQDVDTWLAAREAEGKNNAMLGLTDLDGVIRGKYVHVHKLASLWRKGGGFCDCVFGWDANDQLYDQGSYTGWHTGFPDTGYRLIAESERRRPDSGTPYFVGEFTTPKGEEHPLCPRSLLRRTLQKLRARGLNASAGFEYEFFVFKESAASLKSKNFADLTPLSEGNFGYSVLRAASQSQLFEGLFNDCESFRVPLEGLHCETGPGVWEAALHQTDALEAADRANLFKLTSKAFFQQKECIATFMAKWSMAFPGQSGHFHFSLQDVERNNALSDSGDGEISATGRHAVGGLCRFLPEFLCLFAPTVNSYTRLVRGAWAPTAATWGVENRTCAIRMILGDQERQHIEQRVPGADSNPYLVAAATLGAALLGIEQAIEPPEAIAGNAYDQEADLPLDAQFSPTLRHAATRLQDSSAARELFGNEFVDHFAMTRVWESRQAEANVNDWQLKRYFEII